MFTILIVGFTRRQRDDVSTWLHDENYIPLKAHDIDEALRTIASTKLDLIVVDAKVEDQIPETQTMKFVAGDIEHSEVLSQIRSLLRSNDHGANPLRR